MLPSVGRDDECAKKLRLLCATVTRAARQLRFDMVFEPSNGQVVGSASGLHGGSLLASANSNSTGSAPFQFIGDKLLSPARN